MNQQQNRVLVMNSGSSSIKFAVYPSNDLPQRGLHGAVDRIGARGTTLVFDEPDRNRQESRDIGSLDHRSAAAFLVNWLDEQISLASIVAVGHRIVNGGPRCNEPERVTPELLDELRLISAFAPDHLPVEIALMDLIRERVPSLPQVACFDTAFHRAMPRVAKILPIPRRLQVEGLERYGFHGLSYSFLMQELTRLGGREAASGRIVLAHLGNGASLAAVRGGHCIDTSMGFTPASGVPMSTRSGDLDPGLVWYLTQARQFTAAQFHHMVNHQSGLLGVSETSSDLRDLLALESDDVRAAEAVALFCYQIKKCIGALAAALGGLDTLVFAGGVGENAPVIRSRICADLGFLGIELNSIQNASSAPVLSVTGGRVTVRVVHTDEELMIATAVRRMLARSGTADIH